MEVPCGWRGLESISSVVIIASFSFLDLIGVLNIINLAFLS